MEHNWKEIDETKQFTMKELEVLTNIKDTTMLNNIANSWKNKGMELVEVRTKFIKG